MPNPLRLGFSSDFLSLFYYFFYSLSLVLLFSCSSNEVRVEIDSHFIYCEVWEEIEMFANSSEMNSKSDWDKKTELIERLVSKLPDEWKQTGSIYLNIVKARVELLAQYDYLSPQELPNVVLKTFIDNYYEDQQKADKLMNLFKNCMLINRF
jgi:hypothetical protein|tara:strand:- start:686 stop:1141 length:456 start_codon:yes stop_codon:yes gene_type:complete